MIFWILAIAAGITAGVQSLLIHVFNADWRHSTIVGVIAGITFLLMVAMQHMKVKE